MWSFPKAGIEHSNSSSKLNEFFNDHDAATGLVREAIQNSLDAALSPTEPVRVSFSIATFQWSELVPFLGTGNAGETINDHLNSGDLGKFKTDAKNKGLRSLIIEDNGTKGLVGDTDKDNARSGSNFVGFWWNDGISGKGKGSSGSHGVGKTTLTRISGMSLFLAVTKRSDDARRFLLGFMNLPYHRVGRQSYLGYARFGRLAKNNSTDCFMPIENVDEIEKFTSTFSIERAQPGLSILIPRIPDSVTASDLLLASIRDYYWPILKGDLQIEITDRATGEKIHVSKENIKDVLNNGGLGEKHSQAIADTSHRVEIAQEILNLRLGGNPDWYPGHEPKMTETPSGAIRGTISKECFSEENLERILKSFDEGKLIGFRFALKFKTSDGQQQIGVIDAFFKKGEHKTSDNAQFIRNQIIISKQPSGIPAKNVSCFIVAEDQQMSDYLKEAEEPAHTRWYLNRFNEQKSFSSDWALRFVMELPEKMFRILSREDEEGTTYENFADDIFSVSRPSGAGSLKKKHKSKQKDSSEKDDFPEQRRHDIIRVERDSENLGFVVTPVANIETLLNDEGIVFPFEIQIKAAYVSALGRSRSWKDYSKIDFEFGKDIKIELTPDASSTLLEATENRFRVQVTDADFRISANGFDANRDLLIHPKIAF